MSARLFGALGILSIAACGKDETTDPCFTNVLQEYPEDGAAGVFSRSVIDATLAAPEPTASFTVVDGSGAEVDGATEVDGPRVTFTPAAPFTPGETYTSTLRWSCEDSKPHVNTFTVGAQGTTAVDATSLVDRTWIADLKAGRYVAPYGIGSALDDLVEAQVLLAVEGQSTDTLTLASGAADYDDAQDLCSDTSDYDSPADFAANPFFRVDEDEILLVILGDRLNIRDLTLSGAWDQDGAQLVGVRLDGILDTRDLKEELGVVDDVGVCDLFGATYGVECEDCPDGAGTFCMRLVIDGLTLDEASYDMVPRTLEQVQGDPACATL